MKIYTKTGDNGETSLFGGDRVFKDDLRIQAYGTVDELNSLLGVVLSEIKTEELKPVINKIQNDLFTLGSDLATPVEKGNKGFIIPRIDEKFVRYLEGHIDKYDQQLPELKNFILPGGLKSAALLHVARSICRRAEREVVALSKNVEIGAQIIVYLNRLSDLLFVLARFENHRNGFRELDWKK
jgi:cob(I)alamin adenosyltransferase